MAKGTYTYEPGNITTAGLEYLYSFEEKNSPIQLNLFD